jgi:hypothetical protein
MRHGENQRTRLLLGVEDGVAKGPEYSLPDTLLHLYPGCGEFEDRLLNSQDLLE